MATIGTVLGRGVGKLGALAVEGVVRGAQGAGRFGEDFIAGAEDGYTTKAAALLVTREAKLAEHAKRIEAHKLAMAQQTPVVTTKRVKTA